MENQQQNSNSFWNDIIKEYLDGESMSKLSIKYNISLGTLRYHLIKNSIKVRSVKESFVEKPEIKFSTEFRSLLIGLILGDGSLRISKKLRNPYFSYTDKHKEVHEYLISIFEKNNIKCSKIFYRKNSECYSFQTETRREFLELYNLFYPKEIMIQQKQNRKILPNIILDKIMLLWWYIGDGNSSRQSKSKTHRGQISCKHYNEFILSQFKKFGNCNYYKYNNGGAYYLSNKALIEFLKFIGDCPLECYKYKWITRCSETIMEES